MQIVYDESIDAVYKQRVNPTDHFFASTIQDICNPGKHLSTRNTSTFKLSVNDEHELINYVLKGNLKCIKDYFNHLLSRIQNQPYQVIKELYRYLFDFANIIL